MPVHDTLSRIERHRTAAARRTRNNRTVVVVMLPYTAVNAICVFLAAEGAIHPPWAVLTFFSFWGPGLGAMLALFVFAISRGRSFSWGVLILAIVAALVAAGVNIFFLAHAAASV